MQYETPHLEIMTFDDQDIVRTSNPTPPSFDGWTGDEDGGFH